MVKLPGNQANHFIFIAAMRKIRTILLNDEDISSKAVLQLEDIEQVFCSLSR